jgi:hypothetical protein
MKTPNSDVDPFVEALRGDLPSAADEARMRARLLAAGVAVSSAALSTSSAAMPFGASAAVGAVPGAVTSGAGVGGLGAGVGGSLAAGAPAALVKAGLLSKVLVLPVAAKVGMAATLAVAVAATSVPLVLERDEAAARARTAQVERAAPAADDRMARAASELVPALPSGGRVEAPARSETAAASENATSGSVAASAGAVLPPSPPGMAAAAKLARSGEPQAGRAGSDSTETGSIDTNAAQRGRRAASVVSTPTRRASPAAAVRSAADEPSAPARSEPSAPEPGAREGSEGGRTELVRASSLGEETRLMEQAMVALGEGDRQQARRSLEEHARRFPGGLLQRERERGLARLRQTEAEPPATDSSR